MKKSYRWDNLSSPAIRAMAAQEAIVLIPLGSTEQHGPHLPVGTDAILATFFAEEAAKKLNEMGKPCLVAPTMAPANSMHHMNFAGSISLEPQTYMNQLQEICRAIARHGFRRIVLVNGHGGNSHPSQAALVSINRELGFPVYFLGYWSGTDESKFLESQKGIIHACESETSLMLAVDETLVDPIYKETKGNPGSVTPLEEAGLISTFHTMESHTENGVMGNSYLATKEKGEAMIAEMVGNLTRILSDDCLWHGRV